MVLCVAQVLFGGLITTLNALLIPLLVTHWAQPEELLGLLYGAVAAGSLVGAALAARLAPAGYLRATLAALALIGVTTAALGMVPWLGPALGLLVIIGFATMVGEVVAASAIQTIVDNDRLGRVFGIADSAQRRTVEQRPIVEMQYEHRRVRRGAVDLFQGRHAPLGELKFRPTADDSHPLWWRSTLRLLAQHPQRVGERRHSVPAQLHVVIEAAANRMHVRIVEARNNRPAAEIDNLGTRAAQAHDFFVGADGEKTAILNGHCLDEGTRTAERRNARIS